MKIQPLPSTTIGPILGLCEALDDRGGREDIYRLAHDLRIEFGDLLFIIKAGEILHLIEASGGDVTLAPLGKKAIEVKMNEKKALLRDQIQKLGIFQHFIRFLKNQPEGEAAKEVVLEEIGKLLPSENPKHTFKTLIDWGRYGEIFSYSRDTNSFGLDTSFHPADPAKE